MSARLFTADAKRPARLATMSWWRTGLSFMAGLLILWLLAQLIDWGVIKAIFRPDLAACQALAHHGACWGVIAEKFRPLLLGRYPLDEQWRPWLALALSAVMALIVAAWAWGRWRMPRHFMAASAGVWAITSLTLLHGGILGMASVPVDEWGGLPLTLVLACLSLGLSLPLAILLALGRRSTWRPISLVCTAAIELVRGVPFVTLLFMGAFMLPALFPAQFQPSLFVRVSLALTLFSSAYLAEIIRAGLQTVPKEQIEAAQVLGLKTWRIHQLVVLPQALRAVLPALVSHAIGLLKDTSLAMVVSLHELTGSLGLTLGGDPDWRPFYLEGYLFVAAIYAVMCLGLGWVGRRLESRWQGAVR